MPEAFRLYNTLTRTVEDFQPLEEGTVKLYVCGMTVYDRPHMGHARAYVVFDAFIRSLRARGWAVQHVRNFTDVDDKIIKRANENGEDPHALAQRFIDAFHEDVEALGLLPPDAEPRVSTSIPEIKALIQQLIDRGHAYVSDGSVWFAVDTFDEYGKLSHQNPDALRNPDEVSGKRSPADFALWKAAKPGEPTWESDWGPGRPGWHIECSAMSLSELGPTFDIHGGGVDLVFPHHENEIAQSECGNGAHYARWWMHNGMLTLPDGRKMGKSLGNVFELRSALKVFPAEALRLYLLQSHYRSPIPWGPDALTDALAMLARLYGAKEVAVAMQGEEDADRVAQDLGPDAQAALELGRGFVEKLEAAMADDFNTALALGHAFELARAVNRFANHKKAKKRGGPVVAPALAAFEQLDRSLGLLGADPTAFHEEVKEKRLAAMGQSREQVEALLEDRVAARAAKEWARADEIREDLEDRGILVMDVPGGGVAWRIRL
ncbi:MAG: cysteine--tRNA ligase [Alphaproteobacteria bacterium]|nr:cysteine--tRNA ligase [Alphaproteobacteria bacterium]MCB9796007.1 cysteine--tRNA ligase [Alphaproteobacteria bacterium]